MDSPVPPMVHPRLPGWHTAAALFWFEVFGVAGLLVVAFAPTIGPHVTSPPQSWTDGTVVGGVVALVGAGLSAIGAWLARPEEVRAATFVALGTAGALAIAVAAISDVAVFAAFAFWLGWPSLTLLVVWGRTLREVSRRQISPP